MKTIPAPLRRWFLIHFIIDMIFAIPLFVAPTYTLSFFGFTIIEPVMARLAAAALFAIGGISFWAWKRGLESYLTLLHLKIIWSGMAIIGLLRSIYEGAPRAAWLFLSIFVIFFAIWTYYEHKLRGGIA